MLHLIVDSVGDRTTSAASRSAQIALGDHLFARRIGLAAQRVGKAYDGAQTAAETSAGPFHRDADLHAARDDPREVDERRPGVARGNADAHTVVRVVDAPRLDLTRRGELEDIGRELGYDQHELTCVARGESNLGGGSAHQPARLE